MSPVNKIRLMLEKSEQMQAIMTEVATDPSMTEAERKKKLDSMQETLNDVRMFTMAFVEDYVDSFDDWKNVA